MYISSKNSVAYSWGKAKKKRHHDLDIISSKSILHLFMVWNKVFNVIENQMILNLQEGSADSALIKRQECSNAENDCQRYSFTVPNKNKWNKIKLEKEEILNPE